MRSSFVRCGSGFVSVDLDQDDVSGISVIAQHIEPYDARLVSTGDRVLLGGGQESVQLIIYDRNVDMNDKQAVRHEPTLFDEEPGLAPRSEPEIAEVRRDLVSRLPAVRILEPCQKRIAETIFLSADDLDRIARQQGAELCAALQRHLPGESS
jgi:hypothetical protein